MKKINLIAKRFYSLLLLTTLGVGAALAQNEIVIGDMNSDGELTVSDVTQLTETIVGRTEAKKITNLASKADVDKIYQELRVLQEQLSYELQVRLDVQQRQISKLNAIIDYLMSKNMPDATDNYEDWTSTNHDNNSTSTKLYFFNCTSGDVISFDWSVSSEARYDILKVMVGDTQILTESGENSGHKDYTVTTSGLVTMTVEYTKDGSTSHGEDCATVSNVKLTKAQ